MSKEPLYPHVPKKKEAQSPHSKEFYVKVSRLRGLLGLKKEEIGEFPTGQGAVDWLRELPAGNYQLDTYWDRKPFDSVSLEVKDGEVFGGGMVVRDYHKYQQYVIDRAIQMNRYFSREERDAARDRMDRYVKEHTGGKSNA